MFNYKIIFSLILIFFSYNLFSQLSDLGRFWVNYSKACSPFEVQIMKENVDPDVTVIQYDFEYSKDVFLKLTNSNK